MKHQFTTKNYAISIDFVVYDNAKKFLEPIKNSVTKCMNNTHHREEKMNIEDFENDHPNITEKKEESKQWANK